MRIVSNSGHGLNTAGKRTPPFPGTGKVIHEWEFNHPTSKILEKILKGQGHTPIMVSDTPNDTPLMTRIKKANSEKADAYISIHYNAYQSKWGSHGGIETLYNPQSKEGKKLASLIQTELVKATGLRDRGIKPRTNLGELNHTKMPAVIVECGFMDNLTEASLMLDIGYQTKCANAIARGINAYFGIIPSTSTPQSSLTDINIDFVGKKFKVKGLFKSGTNLVPIRTLEEFGHKVDWNNVTKVATVNYKGRNVVVKGTVFENGVNYVPIRALEQFGHKIDWVGSTRTVMVK